MHALDAEFDARRVEQLPRRGRVPFQQHRSGLGNKLPRSAGVVDC
jgi:hypothetical protein